MSSYTFFESGFSDSGAELLRLFSLRGFLEKKIVRSGQILVQRYLAAAFPQPVDGLVPCDAPEPRAKMPGLHRPAGLPERKKVLEASSSSSSGGKSPRLRL